MKVGAERNKVIALSALGAAAAYLFYSNVLSTPGTDAPKSKAAARIMSTPGGAAPAVAPSPPNIRRARAPIRGGSDGFRPTVTVKPEDKVIITTRDPKLNLDLLAKVRAVERTGGERNLFQFGSAPPPPPKELPQVGKIKPKGEAEMAADKKREEEASKPTTPVKPPPPNIPLRYFGYATPKQTGVKRAFFMDGEEIHVAAEGEIIKKRYKLIRIGVNSVTMEDMDTKNQQTLMILQEQAG